MILGWITTDPGDPDAWPTPDVPVREIFLVCVVTAPLTVVGIRMGLRLLRRHRMLVLFLRRFGHDEAQSAVTFAVVQTIGASWRVVTLDDAEMVPLGVADAPRRAFRVGHVRLEVPAPYRPLPWAQSLPGTDIFGWALLRSRLFLQRWTLRLPASPRRPRGSL